MLGATESTGTRGGHCPVGWLGAVGVDVGQRKMVARILADLEGHAGHGSPLDLGASDHAG